MAVAKKCDGCGKFYEDVKENHFIYEEGDDHFLVNSFRVGNWNARNKCWESIASAYDLCKDCGKKVTQAVFDACPDLVTRRKDPKYIKYQGPSKRMEEGNESE